MEGLETLLNAASNVSINATNVGALTTIVPSNKYTEDQIKDILMQWFDTFDMSVRSFSEKTNACQ